MKKITLFAFLLMVSFGFSQAIPVDFDSDVIVGTNWSADSGLTSVNIVDLPADSPDHGNVGEIVSSSSGQAWQNAQLLLNTNFIDLTDATGSKIINVDVYSDVPQDFLLKLEQAKDGVTGNTEKSFSHSGSGWETIAVDFSTPNVGQPVPNDQYKLLVFFPCYSEGFVDPAFDSTTYIDNVSGVVGDLIASVETTSVTLDFEPEGLGADWDWTVGEIGPAFSVVENPVAGGINTSANVVEFTAFTTDYNWALCFTNDIGEFTFDASNSIVKIMVNKPVISKVNIKFEGSSSSIELSAVNTVTDEWEELTYDFSAQIGNTYNRIVIIPDLVEPYVNGMERETDNTLYIDNIVVPYGVVAPPLPEPLAAPEAPIHDEINNQVISIFSDAYTNVAGTNFNPSWGQSTMTTIESLDGNEVLKYAGLNYQGTEYTAQDVSGLDKIHIDYWTANSTELNFYLISPGNETSFSLPITETETWLSVDIDLSHFVPPVVLSEVFQFKVDGNGTVWFDNLYFYSSESLGVDDYEALSFSVYPNPTNSIWRISANNQNITEVQLFDLLGKEVMKLKPNSTEVEIDASNLLHNGVYIGKITSNNTTKTIKLVKN